MFARLLNPRAAQRVADAELQSVGAAGPASDTIEIALPCSVVPRFAAALDSVMSVLSEGDRTDHEHRRDPGPVSPAVLEALLAMAISHSGGAGRPTVRRSPAGLYSPEYWRISISDASRSTIDVVELAARGATREA